MLTAIGMMIVWWAVTLAIALITWPLLSLVLSSNHDAGFAVARATSGAFVAYLCFLIVFSGLAPNGAATEALAMTLIASCSAAIIWKRRPTLTPRVLNTAIATEGIWISVFIIVCLIRSRNPNVEGLEKFMNFGFINSIYFSTTLPPPDPWYQGGTINYYYFGHFTAASTIRLTGVPLDVGYNLAFASVFAGFAAAIASLTNEMLLRMGKIRYVFPFAGFAAFISTFSGNLHSVVKGLVRPTLAAIGWASQSSYYFADSTRYVGFHPETDDKAFTEFPGYSVIIGDLHAHVMALPLIAALHVVAFALICADPEAISEKREGSSWAPRPFGLLLTASVLIGFDGMVNLWDLPIGTLLVTLVLLAKAAKSVPFSWKSVVSNAGIAGAIAIGAILVELPFWVSFKPFGGPIGLVKHATPLWQLFLLYGGYGMVIGLAGVIWWVRARSPSVYTGVAGNVGPVWIHLWVLSIFVLILIILPETIYIHDIYGADFSRANTMFKTSYHVYVILPAMAVVCYVGTIKRLQFRASRLAFSLFGAMCLMPGLIYPWFGISQLLGTSPPLLRLSGLDFMQQKGSGESEAREFLIAHRPPPGFALLEASGDSYTYAGRMSATTGIPTILGWHAHEWLWRNSLDPWRTRADAIAQFYESSNDVDRRAFIKTYHVYYIVIGVEERSRYPHLDYSGLQRLGQNVFSADGTEIIQVLR